ncbi:hypothetical protein [Fimbriiglobus ruber]|uniref:Uncharacterized protein n=1 Tax=Fimbriiglobus ruber TaxID=1908690 RepID=A0A225DR51_9BACT|nr:hypothetical protein [Fimbriiglobus ruber]OWK42114.1 hypothetical protein FRUB_04192 [Fimbriiglobus ruber]
MTAPDSKLIETVAKAIHKKRQELGFGGHATWEYEPDSIHFVHRETAIAALDSCHAEELIEALQILLEAVRMDLGLFPDQLHKKSAIGRVEIVLAKLDGKPSGGAR